MVGYRSSVLPGNLGTAVNELLASPDEVILHELQYGIGLALALTSRQLLQIRVGFLAAASGAGSETGAVELSEITEVLKVFNEKAPGGCQFIVNTTRKRLIIGTDQRGRAEAILTQMAVELGLAVDESLFEEGKEAARQAVLAAEEARHQAAADAAALVAQKQQSLHGDVAPSEFLNHLISARNVAELSGQPLDELVGVKAHVYYQSGIPAFDAFFDNEAQTRNIPIEKVSRLASFQCRSHAMSASVSGNGWASHYVQWPHAAVEEVHLVRNARQALEEQRGVVGGAVLGGLILGPLGAVLGGLAGLSKQTLQGSGLLVVRLRHESGSMACVFTVGENRYETVAGFFERNYGARFKAGEAVPAPAPPKPSQLVEDLARLSELRQNGHISEEEFRAAKERLLTR